jgi:CRISPR-associated protein Csd2
MTIPRCDIVLIFDCQDGNPNGDPDAGNMPRVDPETMHGLVSDVCQKRKVRDRIYFSQRNADGSLRPGYDIFFGHSGIPDRRILNDQIEAAHKHAVETPAVQERIKAAKKEGDKKQIAAQSARAELCATRFDIRAFGAVLSTGDLGAGQVRGPVQCTFARSVDPVLSLEACITRKAVTKAEDAEKQMAGDGEIIGTMGRKHLIPYGLFISHWFVSPMLAKDTGFSGADLIVLCDALLAMFEDDRSASRGLMATREVVVFAHDSVLGNARAHTLFDRVQATKKTAAIRSFADYDLITDLSNLPAGVKGYRLSDAIHRSDFYQTIA